MTDGAPTIRIDGIRIVEKDRPTFKKQVFENFVEIDMALQELGSECYHLMDAGFDPDAHYTPLECKIRHLSSYLGIDYKEVSEEAYRRLTEKEVKE